MVPTKWEEDTKLVLANFIFNSGSILLFAALSEGPSSHKTWFPVKSTGLDLRKVVCCKFMVPEAPEVLLLAHLRNLLHLLRCQLKLRYL